VIDPKDWPDDGAPEEVLEDEDEYVPADAPNFHSVESEEER